MFRENGGPPEILVAESNPDLQWLYRVWLQEEGYRVRVVGDGIWAVAELTSAPPDLLLVDLHLVGLSGYQIATWLRANPRCAHIPVVAMTDSGHQTPARVLERAGVDLVLVRPFSRAELGLVLQRLLGAHYVLADVGSGGAR